MRRLAVLLPLLALVALPACSPSRPAGKVTIAPLPSTHLRARACVSGDCGPYAAAVSWQGINLAGRTGYYVYLNGSQVADLTASPYRYYGVDCGTTFTIGVAAHDAAAGVSATFTASYTTPACPANVPASTASPAVIDTTLINNFEQPDTVQASAGSWTNTPTSYTYQFQDCTGISGSTGTGCSNIGTPQCPGTAATTCDYTLAAGDVGKYIVGSVTATNANGSSSPVASNAQGTVVASRINTFCSNSTAYTNLTAGPHLCGWPDSTNTGYTNAPGYPGSLTTAAPGSPTCPTTLASNKTYSYCLYDTGSSGLTIAAGLTNITFYGDEFRSNAVNNYNVGRYGAPGTAGTNIKFDYDTFQPPQAGPPVSCSQSYQYGIYNEGGEISSLTVEHSDFWGFGNAIDTSGSTLANPQTFAYNWIHDASSAAAPCNYHPDGIGSLSDNTQRYATVDHNTIEFYPDTNAANLIAWQQGTYSHITNTNNLLSGDGNSYAPARCSGAAGGCDGTFVLTTGNTLNTFLRISFSPLDGVGSPWTQTGSTWNHNYWAVPPGANWGTVAYNGQFWVPGSGGSTYPADCGFVGVADYPSGAHC